MGGQLQNKLLHFEVQPPEEVWTRIAASLNENISITVSEKLYQYEEEPSPLIWQTISSQLDSPVSGKAKLFPFYDRYRRPLTYSGAVAIFIFLAIITTLLINKKTGSELPTHGVASNSTTKKDTSKSPDTLKSDITAKLPEKDQQQSLIARAKVSRIRQEEIRTSYSSSFESFLPQQAERNDIVRSTLPSDKYMIYSDDEGNVFRLPKKIFNAFACPTDDISCKLRLQELKEKFAASAMTTDFTGLLQILKSLQENQ